MRYLIAAAAAVLVLACSAAADIINVPADYTTIQAAVNAASDGDEIVVAPGVYNGSGNSVVSISKSIVLRSSGGHTVTIIDGEEARRGIWCNGVGDSTRIEGFTIRNGRAADGRGGAIYCRNSSPNISSCKMEFNRAMGDEWDLGRGGAVFCEYGGILQISDCEIVANAALGGFDGGLGGAIYADSNTTAYISNSTVCSNSSPIFDGDGEVINGGGNDFDDTCSGLVPGACCAVDFNGDTYCFYVDEYSCFLNYFGEWQGEYVLCEFNPCATPPAGACCNGENCSITTQAGCNGDWLGGGTDCSGNPCYVPPTGACCNGENCSITTQAGCNGDWLGEGTDCSGNPCYAPPTGACCNGENCSIATQAGCNGDWLGEGTDCSGDPCYVPPTGACCTSGPCSITTEADCSGNWLGEGTDCSGDVCDGACCIKCPPLQIAKLTADDGDSYDIFGCSVALDGGVAVIAAYLDDDDNAADSGSAYVFERQVDGSWQQIAKLTADDGAVEDHFGNSVTLDGSVVVIGASLDDDNATRDGSAYVYEKQADGTWLQIAKLTADDGVSDDYFGASVALDGAVAVIGATGDDDNGSHSGSAYVFERHVDGTWQQIAKLTPDDGDSYDQFGGSVAVDDGVAVIGARFDGGNDVMHGSAYVYEKQVDGTWLQIAKLTADDGAVDDYFGQSVATSGGMAVIGAIRNGTSPGSAYVFERQVDGTWQQIAKLTADDGDSSDWFGNSVALDGSVVVIGAYLDDDNAADSGSAYVYEQQTDGSWQQIAKLTADDGDSSDWFGNSVALDDGVVVIGVRLDDENGTNSGSAYVYEIIPQEDCNWTVDDDGPADFDNIQDAVNAASNGNTVTVMPGTYRGDGSSVVDLLGKSIALIAAGTTEETIIDGEGSRRAIVCSDGANSIAQITGFTFTNGHAPLGAGIYLSNSDVILENCAFVGNAATYDGGAIALHNSSTATVSESTFMANSATYGGAIYLKQGSEATVVGCSITNNLAGQLGGGVYCESSNLSLENCAVLTNTATNGGGIYCGSSNPTLAYTTVCGNDPDQILGNWTDSGGNTIADECPDCPDINGDGEVGVDEILAVIAAWDTDDADADVNGDGIVDTNDILLVLSAWGPCPE